MFDSQFSDISVDDAILFLMNKGYTIFSPDDPNVPMGGCRSALTHDIKQYSGYMIGIGIGLVLLNMLRTSGLVRIGYGSEPAPDKS